MYAHKIFHRPAIGVDKEAKKSRNSAKDGGGAVGGLS